MSTAVKLPAMTWTWTLSGHCSFTALPTQVVKSVAEGRDVERRGALALALGAIHRAKGGLSLQVGTNSPVLVSMITWRMAGQMLNCRTRGPPYGLPGR
jgi:hypothetical protein